MLNRILVTLLALFPLASGLEAVAGKVDVGYTNIDLDVINAGEVDKSLELHGVAANGTISIIHCVVVKPNFVWTQGDGDYYSTGLGLGAYIPFWNCFSVVPHFGGGYSHLKARIDFPNFGLFNLKQHNRSRSLYVACDGSWKIMECLSLSATLQYAWARIDTTIPQITKQQNDSSGFNYFAQVDYYILPCLTVNGSVAYLTSRSKERHGSDAIALRAGMGVLF